MILLCNIKIIYYEFKIGKVANKCFGIQIKPITVNANLGNYDITARMRQSFEDFRNEFGGQVFIVYSDDEKIINSELLYEQINKEIIRLQEIDNF